MNHHEHYGNWTIEWREDDPGQIKFWIQTNLAIPNRGLIEVYTLFIDCFETAEMGVYRCRRIIEEINSQQRNLFSDVAHEYMNSLKPPAPPKESVTIEEEDDDRIPF